MEALTEAHCRYYCDFLAQRKLGTTERAQVETSAEIEGELDNIRTAWQYAVDHKQIDLLAGKVGQCPRNICRGLDLTLEYLRMGGGCDLADLLQPFAVTAAQGVVQHTDAHCTIDLQKMLQ